MATNTSEDKWATHLDLIAKLYIDKCWSWDQIAVHLTSIGLQAKGPTVKVNVQKRWGIRRLNPQEELEILAKCLLHYRAQGREISFLRFGEPFPKDEIEDFLKRNPQTQPSGVQLPVHLKTAAELSSGDASGDERRPPDDVMMYHEPARDSFVRRDLATVNQTSDRHGPARFSPIEPIGEAIEHSTDSQQHNTRLGDYASENEEGENPIADARVSKYRELQRAIATVKEVSRYIGLDHVDITNILLRPEMLQDLAYRDWLSLLNRDPMRGIQAKSDMSDTQSLHFAAWHDIPSMLGDLLRKVPDHNARDGNGRTALHVAAGSGSLLCVKHFLRYTSINFNLVDGAGCTPLMLALKSRSKECATDLALTMSPERMALRDRRGQNALHIARLQCSMASLLHTLLRRIQYYPSQLRVVNAVDHDGRTPLHLAVSQRSEEYVRLLLRYSANCNIRDKKGETPVHLACKSGDIGLIQTLIRHERVDLSVTTGESHSTVLHLVCEHDLTEIAKEVLESGKVDIDATDDQGYTPLMVAFLKGRLGTCRMLLEYGAEDSGLRGIKRKEYVSFWHHW